MFNIKKFYVNLRLRVCVLNGSHSRQRLLPYTILADWFCITEAESVCCAVRTESLYKTDTFSLQRDKLMYSRCNLDRDMVR